MRSFSDHTSFDQPKNVFPDPIDGSPWNIDEKKNYVGKLNAYHKLLSAHHTCPAPARVARLCTDTDSKLPVCAIQFYAWRVDGSDVDLVELHGKDSSHLPYDDNLEQLAFEYVFNIYERMSFDVRVKYSLEAYLFQWEMIAGFYEHSPPRDNLRHVLYSKNIAAVIRLGVLHRFLFVTTDKAKLSHSCPRYVFVRDKIGSVSCYTRDEDGCAQLRVFSVSVIGVRDPYERVASNALEFLLLAGVLDITPKLPRTTPSSCLSDLATTTTKSSSTTEQGV